MTKPTLFVTRLLGPNQDIPVRGSCSVCNEEFDVTSMIGADRGHRLNLLFEQHIKHKHPEEDFR